MRAIGMGTRNHHHLHWAMATRQCDVILPYRDYNLLSQALIGDVLPEAGWLNVGVMNGTAIIRGLLAGDNPREVAKRIAAERNVPGCHIPSPTETERAHAIWERCGELGVGMLSVCLQFCMQETRIASTLVGAANPDEITSAVAAVTDDVPAEAWQALRNDFGLLGAQVP